MIISPKSPAERVTQFANLPPTAIELPQAEHIRYSDAYAILEAKISDGSPNEVVIETLDQLEASHSDIIAGSGLYSYVSHLRMLRYAEETAFASMLNSSPFKQLPDEVITQNSERLRSNVMNLGNATKEQAQRFFPSGNYFLHSTYGEHVIGILESGAIKSTVGFATHEERMERSNGGAIGVSGNYNNTTNLLGDARHLAGFITDPLIVLKNQGGYFSVPSKSCWDELQYYGDDPTDIMDIREIETQYNHTYNLVVDCDHWTAAVYDTEMPSDKRSDIQQEYASAIAYIKARPEAGERAHRVDNQGRFWFTEMLGNDGEPINPAVVLLYAGSKGRLGADIAKAINSTKLDYLSPAVIELFGRLIQHVAKSLDEVMESDGKRLAQKSQIAVENTYFYCPERDLEKWLPLLSAAPHQPRGIITYGNRLIRVPTAFRLRLPDPGSDSLKEQLSIVADEQSINWMSLFDDKPKQHAHMPFLIRPREANLAGVITLEGTQLVTKSFDDIYE